VKIVSYVVWTDKPLHRLDDMILNIARREVENSVDWSSSLQHLRVWSSCRIVYVDDDAFLKVIESCIDT